MLGGVHLVEFFWWFFTSCHGNSVKQYESICMCLLVLRSQAFLQVPVLQSDFELLPRLIDFVAASIKRNPPGLIKAIAHK